LVVAPGFVDIHTHYDAQVLWDSELTVSPWHGVTTAVLGNCGFGVAPTRPEHRDLILRTLERVEGMSLSALEEGLGSPWSFETFTQYMDLLERTALGINVAVMVGHTPVRLWVMGDEATTRAATASEVAQMRALVREAMDEGAVGFATSVSKVHVGYSGRPVPSRLADFEEMLELARAVGDSGHGLIHYNVGREPLWQAYEQLHAVSGRPVVWTSLLAGSLGPGSHRAQLEQAAQQRLRGLPIHGQGACRPIQFEFDFRSPVLPTMRLSAVPFTAIRTFALGSNARLPVVVRTTLGLPVKKRKVTREGHLSERWSFLGRRIQACSNASWSIWRRSGRSTRLT
jgi:N-acyl-D-aspartate/D-glutamate deacylase